MKICKVEGCNGEVKAKGLCLKHYKRLCKYGTTDLPHNTPIPRTGTCSVEGCTKKVHARGLCAAHYEEQRLAKRGEVCTVEGCKTVAYAHGLCRKHYARKQAHGTTDNPRQSPMQRFMASYEVNHKTGCWMWTGGVESKGYGRIHINGKRVKGHQAAWILFRGPIPEGMCICHKCDTPGCVNPDHLFLGTMADNMRDKVKKGRQSSRGYNNHQEFLDVCFAELGMAKGGMTAKEIAQKVDRPVGTVRWHMTIARKELRKMKQAA